MKHFWIKIENELPPANVLVWVKRNVRGNESYYLASRNSKELSTDPDASRNCHWSGTSIDLIRDTPESGNPLSLRSQFSDITVKEWCFLEPPVDLEVDGKGCMANKLIEVTPKVFLPDYSSDNPFDGETVSQGTILINTDYIKLIEGSSIVISIDGQDRFYSVFESYEEIIQLIK